MSGQMLLFDEVHRAKLSWFTLANPHIFNKTRKPYTCHGTHFKNGKLYLFRGDHVTVVRPWGEKAGAWRKTRKGAWKHIRPHINVERAYVYRVLEPERATLSICRKGAVWLIDQLKGFANKQVLNETVRQVQRWLVSEQEKSFSVRALPLME